MSSDEPRHDHPSYDELLAEAARLYPGVRIGRPGRARTYWATITALRAYRAKVGVDLAGAEQVAPGPAIFVAHAEDDHNFQPPRQSNNDTTLGVKVGAGVMWYFTPVVAMFGEYRWTHFHPDFTLAGVTDLTTDINTHYVLVGVSFHF